VDDDMFTAIDFNQMESTDLHRGVPSNISAGVRLVQPVGILLDEIHKMESHASRPSVGFQLVGSQAEVRLVLPGGLCWQSTCVHNPLDGIPHVGFPQAVFYPNMFSMGFNLVPPHENVDGFRQWEFIAGIPLIAST
jgi:hypothetical protein